MLVSISTMERLAIFLQTGLMDNYLLLAARTTSGLLAGLYFAFVVGVMPALHRLNDAAFVEVMRRINVSIVNPVFLLIFLAAPVLAVVAGVLVRTPLLYAAAFLAVLTLLITLLVSIPLNDKLAASGSRTDFENLWVQFNTLRTLTGIGSFVCLLLSRSTVP